MHQLGANRRGEATDELAAAPVWRARVLQVLLGVTAVLGTLVAIPSIGFALSIGEWGIAAVDTVALAVVVVLALRRSLSHGVRAVGLLAVCYVLGVFLFVVVGPVLSAYFLAVPVLAAVVLGTRAAVAGLVLNTVTIAVLGLFAPIDPLVITDEPVSDTVSWLVVTANFTFVNVMITASAAALLSRFERSLALNRRLALAVEQSPESIVIAEPDGTIVYRNSAAVDLLGDAAAGSALLHDLLAGSDPPLPYPLPTDGWTAVVTAGSVAEPRLFDLTLLPVAEREGGMQLVLIVRDVTGERAAQEAEARAQRLQALGTLVAGTAHDFNNALASMVGQAELLRAELDEDARASVDGILHTADSARGVVRQLMAFGRLRAGQDELTDIGATIRADQRGLAALVPSGIRFEVTTVPGLLVALAPSEIHQVVTNLVTNAVHALEGRGEGTIRVTLSEEPHDDGSSASLLAVLRVSDDGAGIDAALLPTVFDPFVTTKPPEKGSGLGLASVHGVVTAAGGAVEISSRPGEGTTVTISLPAEHQAATSGAADPNSEPGEDDTSSSPRSDEGLRVLVVDDESSIASSTTRLLERRGYAATACSDPQEAARMLEAGERFDIVLTDVSMPTMSGLDLADLARRHLPDATIVAMSGYGEVMSDADRARLGIAAIIDKPFAIDDLVACLDTSHRTRTGTSRQA